MPWKNRRSKHRRGRSRPKEGNSAWQRRLNQSVDYSEHEPGSHRTRLFCIHRMHRSVLAVLCVAAVVGGASAAKCVPAFGASTQRAVTVAKGGAVGTKHLGTPRDLQVYMYIHM
jgi:hypothetical protein